MSKELKNLDSPGRQSDIVFFLGAIIGEKSLPINDLRVLCAHAPGGYKLQCDALISYCTGFGWINIDDYVHINETLLPNLVSQSLLNNYLVKQTVRHLFVNEVFRPDMFFYNVNDERVIFRNELLPLSYSTIRNVLISQGLLTVYRDCYDSIFYVNSPYESLIAEMCGEYEIRFTLSQFKSQLERKAEMGEKAEAYALAYEKRRLSNQSLIQKIRRVSEIDVCAGYDIISFETNQSISYDRYIEVKAVSSQNEFFWSSNEYETAKLKGSQYYLYLVDLSKANTESYIPTVINNPAVTVMKSDAWLIEAETYHIRKI